MESASLSASLEGLKDRLFISICWQVVAEFVGAILRQNFSARR